MSLETRPLSVKVTLSQNTLSRLKGKYREEVTKFVSDAGEHLIATIKADIKRNEFYQSGELHKSFKTAQVKILPDGTIALQALTNDRAAAAIEYGTNASGSNQTVGGFDITQWALKKEFSRPINVSRKQLGFLTARKIARKGMTLMGKVVKDGQRRPFNASQKKAQRQINAQFAQLVKRLTEA